MVQVVVLRMDHFVMLVATDVCDCKMKKQSQPLKFIRLQFNFIMLALIPAREVLNSNGNQPVTLV